MVKLELQNSLNKFAFRNDKLEKDKVDMSVIQKLRFFNGGNAPAEIRWEENKEKAFKIVPMKDTILPQREKEVSISIIYQQSAELTIARRAVDYQYNSPNIHNGMRFR